MIEELFIIRNNKRCRLDLSVPSGITLNFKSNIFRDLSKITASYSYTFKLPMTANNRRVLDNADDIRASSSVTHQKLKGEYVQNGIPIFDNVNLYIESVEESYNCVMTWGDAMVFGQIKDDNLRLNELTYFDDVVEWGSLEGRISQFNNFSKTLNNVVYNAGVTGYNFHYDSRVGKHRIEISSLPFVPVVPVPAILNAIASKYGISFPFVKYIDGTTWNDEDNNLFDVINKGVLPFVNHQLSAKQYSDYYATLNGVSFTKDGPTTIDGREFKNIVTFSNIKVGNDVVDLYGVTGHGNGYIYISTTVYGGNIAVGFSFGYGVKVKITGCFRIKFSDCGSQIPKMKLCRSKYEGYDKDGSHYSWIDIAEVVGKRVDDSTDLWEFDFRDTTTSVPLEYESPYGSSSIEGFNRFWFSNTITSFTVVEQFKILPIEISDDGKFYGRCNPMECMPETTILDFLKSLFFMTGTFPVFKNNILNAVRYDILSENVKSSNVYHWDDKLTTQISRLPVKTSFLISDFANRNYYCMSTDNTDRNSTSDSKDVYAKGLTSFNLGNMLISTKEKTIVKLPWAPPYLKNRDFPNEDTGSTIKSWIPTGDETVFGPGVKYSAPKPAYGVICQRAISHIDNEGKRVDDGKVMSLRIWNDLNSIITSDSMRYMISILNKPIVITENFVLDEFDLRDIDFSTPVYLDKYNAYFAIVSITRDSKGICKCELIKLPEEE